MLVTSKEIVLEGVTDQLGGAREAELLLHPGFVRADGLDREVELLGDLGRRAPGGEQAEDLELAVREQAVRRHVDAVGACEQARRSGLADRSYNFV